MAASSSSKDKFFDNVINPYLSEVNATASIYPDARWGAAHPHVQGPKGTGIMEVRLEAYGAGSHLVQWDGGTWAHCNHLMIAD
ncbi:hypothetical protein D1007_16011 [Hordeum vulgare]|nr:hypothetical protein D1007_16011 [Hordeum vulgare]